MINKLAGALAEKKDIARKISKDQIEPSIRNNERISIDFNDVECITQGFIHALISEPMRRYGSDVLDLIIFRNCNENVRKIILIVSDYMQESES